jgi:hypothetical protein
MAETQEPRPDEAVSEPVVRRVVQASIAHARHGVDTLRAGVASATRRTTA